MTTDSDSLQAATRQDLIREVRQLRQKIQELREENQELKAEIGDLHIQPDRQETEISELRGDLQQERHDRKLAGEELKIQRTQQIARAKADVREDVQDLHETVVAEQMTRSRADARLKRHVNELAGAAAAGTVLNTW